MLHESNSHTVCGISITLNDTLNLDTTLLNATQLYASFKHKCVLGDFPSKKKKSQKVYLHHVNNVIMMCCVTHVFQFFFVSKGESKGNGRLGIF